MNTTKQTVWVWFLGVVFTLVSASCVHVGISIGPNPTAALEEGYMQRYTIDSNTQLHYDNNLAIGVGGYRRDEYVDAEGVTRRGRTMGLWMSVKEQSSPNLTVRVHVGQEVVYDRYVIKVVEIDQRGWTWFVRLAIKDVGDPGVEWPTTVRAEGEGPYEILPNTQLIYLDDNLLVGAGNFSSEKYDDEQGVTVRRDICVLWLAVRDGAAPGERVQVHAGKEVAFGQYVVQVVEVRDHYYRTDRGIDREDFQESVLITVGELQTPKE